MSDNNSDTKIKILEAARILFASRGFEGTSIRDIAKAAEVNIASVNYHFSNKENLFLEIMRKGYHECAQEMRMFYDEHQPAVDETLIYLFRYFLKKSHDLMTYFKMMMSELHSHHMVSDGGEDATYGPPGAKVIIDAILREVGKGLKEEDYHWALKTLFGHVIHMSLMYSICFNSGNFPFTTQEDLEKDIERLAKVVIKELMDR